MGVKFEAFLGKLTLSDVHIKECHHLVALILSYCGSQFIYKGMQFSSVFAGLNGEDQKSMTDFYVGNCNK